MKQVKVLHPGLLDFNIFVAIPDNVYDSGANNQFMMAVPVPVESDIVYTRLSDQDWGTPVTPGQPILFIVPAPQSVFPPVGPTYWKNLISPDVTDVLDSLPATDIFSLSSQAAAYLQSGAFVVESASVYVVFYTRLSLRDDSTQRFINQTPLGF